MSAVALGGLRVIDLGQVFAGPYAARLLADMGAEVIRVESRLRSGRGGAGSQPGAIYPGGEAGEHPYNRSAYYNELNRNKYAVSLDLSHERGREIFRGMVRVSDAVVENFTPRVMANFGLDYRRLVEVNPGIIMVSISGYGHSGPYRDYVAFGPGVEAMSGLSCLTSYPGGRPLPLGIAYADPTAALHAAFALLVALRYRRRSGRGQHIDLSMHEALISLLGEQVVGYAISGRAPKPLGNRHPGLAPQGCYRSKGRDRWVAIVISSEEEWASFCRAIGSPPWCGEERFATVAGRLENHDELDRLIEGWTRRRDPRQAMEILQRSGVSAGAVLDTGELVGDPHLEERGYFERVTHPEAGTHLHPGMPWKLSRTPGGIRGPAPCFAEHNDYVFGQLLGLSPDEVSSLAEEGVISTIPLA